MTGRLTGTCDGRPVQIFADETGVTLDIAAFRSAWKLRSYVGSIGPVLTVLKAGQIPLTVRVANIVSVRVLPKAGLLAKLFAPALAKA